MAIEVIEKRLFASSVADEIQACVEEVLQEKEFCNIALAGGKTPGGVYRILARPPKLQDLDWSHIKLFWGDERWVDPDDVQNNYRLARETLLDQLPQDKLNCFPIDVTLESPEKAAAQYEEVLMSELGVAKGEVPVFDLVILGVATDGHIGSLFPGSLGDSKSPVLVTTNPSDGGKRITLSRDVFVAAKRVIFIVSGEHKAEILKTTFQDSGSANEVPAKLHKEMKGQVRWFIDTSAAKLIPEYHREAS